jgi:hypothetical protein
MTVDPNWIQPTEPTALSGEEQFLGLDDVTVRDFWTWSTSDLRENTIRGVLAEFIVAKSVGAEHRIRVSWDNYDVLTPSGIRVEVKSSAYLQSWPQRVHSTIRFSGLMGLAWDPETNTSSEEREVRADVFVFAIQTCRDAAAYDALDLTQWEFHVAPAKAVRENGARSVGIGFLERHASGPIKFDALAEIIEWAHSADGGDLKSS